MTRTFQFFQNLDLDAFAHHVSQTKKFHSSPDWGCGRGLGHLSRDDLTKLHAALENFELAGVEQDTLDNLIAELFDHMPWMAQPLQAVHQALSLSSKQDGICHFKPVLLVGSPGVGKSHMARRLAGGLGLPFTSLDVGTGAEAWKLTGLTRGWSSAHPGRVLETILENRIGNPVVVLDELDKAVMKNRTTANAVDVCTGLLGLLEPISSKAWECPYFQIQFDMSHVNWIVTANTTRGIPEPLLSRFDVVHVPDLTVSDLMIAARAEGRKRGLHPEDIDMVEDLLNQYPAGHPSLNMRKMLRLVDQLEGVAKAPRLH